MPHPIEPSTLRILRPTGIAALLPVIICIGTEETHHELHEATHDVTIWWP